jgi:hypothetical protein
MSNRRRILFSVTIALVAGFVAYIAQDLSEYRSLFDHPAGDFRWTLRAGSDLLHGREIYRYPYGPFAIPYPLPAAFVGALFAWISSWQLAAAVFVAMSSFLMAWTLLAEGESWRLLAFCSFSYWQAVVNMQWSPLIVAMAGFGWLLPMLLVKPNIALIVASLRKPTYLGIGLTGVLLLFSFIIYPTWPFVWRSQVTAFLGFVPLLVLPIGPLILLAVVRWRDARARLLLVAALMPQHRYGYDQLVLWLIPPNRQWMLLLSLASWPVGLLGKTIGFWYGDILITWLLYLPCLVMVMQPELERLRLWPYRGSCQTVPAPTSEPKVDPTSSHESQ